METKNKSRTVQKIQRRCGFNDFIFVEPQGLSGDLSLAWKSEYVADVIHTTDFFFSYLYFCIYA